MVKDFVDILIRNNALEGLLIFSTFVGIRNTNTGIDRGFEDIKITAGVFENFKRQYNNLLKLYSYKIDSDWSSGKIELTLEEINLRATLCVIH